jgi:hypothetical protein
MYIPVSTATVAFSNISKKIKEQKYNNYDNIPISGLILAISIMIFLVFTIYKIHTTKIKII